MISEAEEGTAVADVPNGIYGFTWAPQSEAPLFRKQGFQSFEIHKAANGEIDLIGFISEDDAKRMADSKEEFYINLFPVAHESATKAICIARSQILQHRDPTRNAGNSIELKLEPRRA